MLGRVHSQHFYGLFRDASTVKSAVDPGTPVFRPGCTHTKQGTAVHKQPSQRRSTSGPCGVLVISFLCFVNMDILQEPRPVLLSPEQTLPWAIAWRTVILLFPIQTPRVHAP